MKTVREVLVKDVEKRKYPSKHYVYVIEVTWSEGTTTTVYRRYTDFFEFQCKLLEHFPLEGGIKDPTTRMIPFLPGKIILGRSHIRSVAEKRKEKINEYCRALVRLPPKISDSEFVLNFFEVTPEDINPPDEQINSKGKQNPIESISDPIVLERYVAIADYVKQKKNECSLKEGQTVEVVDKNQNGWWFVNLDDCNEGWVPATYLEPIYGTEEAQSEVLKPGEEQTHVTTAVYKAQNADELSFEKGVLVEVFEKNVDGWWKARYGSKEGFVPAAYLARYRGVVGQSASPVEGVASPKDALSPTAGRKAKQDNASITQSPTPFTPGPTQKKSGYDDEPIYCHIPRKKSIDKKPLKDILAKSERPVPPEVPKPRAQTTAIKQEGKEEEEEEEGEDPSEDAPLEVYVTLAEFNATAGDGLSFKAGETVSVVTKNQSGWWYVEMKNKEGWVPSSYLEKATPTAQAPSKPLSNGSDTTAPKFKKQEVSSKPEVTVKKPEVTSKPEVTVKKPEVTSKPEVTVKKPEVSSKPEVAGKRPEVTSKPEVTVKKPEVSSKPEVAGKRPDILPKKPDVAVMSTSPTSSPSPTSPSQTTVSESQSFDSDLKGPTSLPKPKPASKTPSPVRHNSSSSLKKAKSIEDLQGSSASSNTKMSPFNNVLDGRANDGDNRKPSVAIKKGSQKSTPELVQSKGDVAPPLSIKLPTDGPRLVAKKPTSSETDVTEPPQAPKPPPYMAMTPALQQVDFEKALKKQQLGKKVSADAIKPSDAHLVTSRSESSVKQDARRPPPPRPEPVAAEKATPPKRPTPPSVQKTASKVPPPRPGNSPALVAPSRPGNSPALAAHKTAVYTTLSDYEGDTEGCIQFEEGEEVTEVMEKREDGWWFIKIGSREGWAPSTFLDEIKSPSKAKPARPEAVPTRPSAGPKKPSVKNANLFKAIETYRVSSSDDASACIDLVKGVSYEVVEKGDGWWFVRDAEGNEGWVPSTYLDSL